MDYHGVWYGVWHILVGSVAQRYASYIYGEGLGCAIRHYIYAKPRDANYLDAFNAVLDFVCAVYFGVETLEEEEGVSKKACKIQLCGREPTSLFIVTMRDREVSVAPSRILS